MGAWATDSFSNDDALDWLLDFVEAPTTDMLRDTIENIVNFDADDELEAPDCAEAIAAAEIVAALTGNPAANLPDDLRTWLQSDHGFRTNALTVAATAAIKRIGHDSELKELWAGSDFNAQWLADMADLERRLA